MRAVFPVVLALMGLMATGLRASPSHVTAERFVGAERCGECHAYALKVWKRSAHSRALGALDARARKDPKCLQCHSTDPSVTEGTLAGVQCEACHGPGRHYSASYVMRDRELREALGFSRVDKRVCLRCHTASAPSLTPFVFAEKMARIAHAAEPPVEDASAGKEANTQKP